MWSSLEGLVIGDRYELLEHLATGGMAVVFKGWDHRVQRPVAIKMLRQLERADRDAVSGFQREAHAIAMLNHPNVVRAYDFFEEYGCCYLVMELVDGLNLKQRLRHGGPIPQVEAIAIAEQVCSALEAVHAQGFVHRDIKPQNILLDADGNVKVADFGIVHFQQSATLTADGMVLGTADYIAPEQARGEDLSPATDVYALGVVLFEMLTGQVPFTGATPTAVATRHASEAVPPPSRVMPAVSPFVEAIVLRALQKQPARRYQSAASFAEALQVGRELLSGTPAEQPNLTEDIPVGQLTAPAPDSAPALAAVGAATPDGAFSDARLSALPASQAHGSATALVASRNSDPELSTLGWSDIAAALIAQAPVLPFAGAASSDVATPFNTDRGFVGAVAIGAAAKAPLLRLALVALASLALLFATLGLELWLNVHGGGSGLPFP